MRIGTGLLACTAAAMTLQLAVPALAAPHLPKAPASPTTFLVPPDQVVAIKAAQMYDAAAGKILANQVIIIHGDRIVDVGPNVAIPAGARVIDFPKGTVMPGMIDAHVHTYREGDNPGERAMYGMSAAQRDLDAGFTSLRDMDTGGGFGTVDLRDLIDYGLILGPRMQVVGQSLNNRNMAYVTDPESGRYYTGRTEGKDVNGPWLARAAVREAKQHGVDSIKIYSSQDYDGEEHLWLPDGSFQVFPELTNEEAQAIVDEAHRIGLKVACHSYLGGATDPCLIAGVDSPQHLLQLDAAGIKMLKEKHLTFTPTIDDLIHLDPEDLAATHGANSRLKMTEAAFKLARANGIPIAFGSGATGTMVAHGKQANQFAYMIKWGMTPAEALSTTYIAAPRDMNHHFEKQVGTIEKGKFADIIAVAGNPLDDITEMERVKFVMKGGLVVRDNGSAGAMQHYQVEHPK